MAGTPKAEITLGLGDGAIAVPVYEQSVPYLMHRVGKFIDAVQGMDLDAEAGTETVLALLGGQAYQALAALIPNLPARMPEWTFRGFASKDQMDRGEFDEDAAMKAPSMAQIRSAFKTALEANGLELSGLLGKWLDPTLLRPALNLRVAEWISGTSLSSPSANGAMTPSESGTTSRTPTGTALEASPA